MAIYRVKDCAELQYACDNAVAGTIIEIVPGLYPEISRMQDVRGTQQDPVIIRPASRGWIRGGKSPDYRWRMALGGGYDEDNPAPQDDPPPRPSALDFAFLQLIDCEFIHIQDLEIKDCWPSILFIQRSHHLKISGCRLEGGTNAIFAKEINTSHILIEDNSWQQDTSPGHDLWTCIDWVESHGGESGTGTARQFNGGFFSTKDIAGNIVIRKNKISDAYNGIRCKANYANRVLKRGRYSNSNIHIYDNDFERIRDNPIEPEGFAFNWHIRHNRLTDCHSWFSFDGVGGGYWYFYGNVGSFKTRQGLSPLCGGKFDAPHTMGRVLKLSYQSTAPGNESGELSRVPEFPWYVINNSFFLRCPIIGGANPHIPVSGEGPDMTANLNFINNAFAFAPLTPCDWTVVPIEPIRNFSFAHSSNVRFDYSLWSWCPPYLYAPNGSAGTWFERSGIKSTSQVFQFAHPVVTRPADFKLAARSSGLSSASLQVVERPQGRADEAKKNKNGKLHRGAWQDYGLTSFKRLEAEARRITREL